MSDFLSKLNKRNCCPSIEPRSPDSKADVLLTELLPLSYSLGVKLGKSIYFVLIPRVQIFVGFQLLHFSSTIQVLHFNHILKIEYVIKVTEISVKLIFTCNQIFQLEVGRTESKFSKLNRARAFGYRA